MQLRKAAVSRCILYAVLIITSLLMIAPFLWMISSSLKLEKEVFEVPIKWIPEKFQWTNFAEVFERGPFLRYYLNTVVIAVSVTVLQIVTCSLAAYAFSKIEFPERDTLFLLYLSTMMIPFAVIMIPQFVVIRTLGLLDSLLALVLLHAFNPFGVFLFRQFFMGIPGELSQSARIDGCGEFCAYSRIVLPLAGPAIVSLVIFTFVAQWNDFLGPLIYLSTETKKTLQLGLRTFRTQYNQEYALLMAASLVAMLPTILVYLFAQKRFVEGVAVTGLKG